MTTVKKKQTLVLMTLALLSTAAFAKPCDELKGEIDAKLQAKGAKGYSLDVVAADAVKDQKVVGSCEGGTKKIVYTRGAAATTPSPAPAS
ncbi:MAG: DUF1161 domain-containing protein [Steroidobacteraceae bacterium]